MIPYSRATSERIRKVKKKKPSERWSNTEKSGERVVEHERAFDLAKLSLEEKVHTLGKLGGHRISQIDAQMKQSRDW